MPPCQLQLMRIRVCWHRNARLAAPPGSDVVLIKHSRWCGGLPRASLLEHASSKLLLWRERPRRPPAFLCWPSVYSPQSSKPASARHLLLHCARRSQWLQVEVNGAGMHPVYHFLRTHTPEDRGGSGDIDWNFAKWVVDKHVRCFPVV